MHVEGFSADPRIRALLLSSSLLYAAAAHRYQHGPAISGFSRAHPRFWLGVALYQSVQPPVVSISSLTIRFDAQNC